MRYVYILCSTMLAILMSHKINSKTEITNHSLAAEIRQTERSHSNLQRRKFTRNKYNNNRFAHTHTLLESTMSLRECDI